MPAAAACATMLAMEHRLTIHLVDAAPRYRAEGARAAFALGHHAEVYEGLQELRERPPRDGIVIARDDPAQGGAPGLLAALLEDGIWLPLVAAGEEPRVDRVVAAIKAGALGYISLPYRQDEFARVLADVAGEAHMRAQERRRVLEARQHVAALSHREGEVLSLLSNGCSNKEIARELEISPRTVEIHRANMMRKLKAHHASDAVRVWFEAGQTTEPALN
ncbi:MAG: response regulator transcription factor [Novosphingobium sp.]